jgi:hypothetical protein
MECLDTPPLHVRMCERFNGKHSQGSQVEVSRCSKYFDQILVGQTLSKLGLFLEPWNGIENIYIMIKWGHILKNKL